MNAPPDVEILQDAQLFVWRPRGVLDEDKVNKIIAFVTEQENKYGKPFNRFTDLSLLDAIDLSFKFVFHVALHRRIARLGQKAIKSAFLVTTSAVGHYVKLHALVTDRSPLKVAIFKDRESAAKWLGVSAELLAPSK